MKYHVEVQSVTAVGLKAGGDAEREEGGGGEFRRCLRASRRVSEGGVEGRAGKHTLQIHNHSVLCCLLVPPAATCFLRRSLLGDPLQLNPLQRYRTSKPSTGSIAGDRHLLPLHPAQQSVQLSTPSTFGEAFVARARRNGGQIDDLALRRELAMERRNIVEANSPGRQPSSNICRSTAPEGVLSRLLGGRAS